MNDDLPCKAAFPNPLHQAAGYPGNRGIRHAEPEDIGFQLSAIECGQRQSACCAANHGARAAHDNLVQAQPR